MKALYSIALAAALAAGQAHAACSYPTEPPAIPDGSTATLDQMVAAQKAVREYDQKINAYTACLKLEHETTLANSPDLTDQQKKEMERMQVQKHNAAVEADEALAARFNEQLKTFKAKNARK